MPIDNIILLLYCLLTSVQEASVQLETTIKGTLAEGNILVPAPRSSA